MIIIDDKTHIEFSNMGEFIGEGEWIHPEISTKTYEIIFVTKGDVFLDEDGVKYDLAPGDLICLKPGLVHKGYKHSSGVRFFWLHFFAEHYDEIGVYKHKASDDYNYSAFFKQLCHLATLDADKALIECKLVAFLLDIKRGAIGKNKLFSDVCEYVRVHIADNPSVTSISEHFSYNPDYLTKVFLKNAGIGLKRYVDRERNAYVKNLLLTTTKSLKEIADACAFDSDNSLIKFFKYNNGISPTAFRNTYYASHTNKH